MRALVDRVTAISRIGGIQKFRPAKIQARRRVQLPSVFVVPVYVEVSAGFERAVDTLESYLRRAGYVFHTGEPLPETLDDTKRALGDKRESTGNDGGVRAELSP